jgi:GMP synthase (glutamine-hydrolysing)
MSHGDSIERLPDGFRPTASTGSTPTPPSPTRPPHVRHPVPPRGRPHPKHGREILRNFVVDIAGARQNWTPANFIASNVEEIRRRVDEHSRATGTDGKVLCALSGGVDSAVAATLVHRAVGDRLICVHVDHGMMRKNETELLAKAFEQLGVRVIVVNARERFLRKLEGVIDPEQKRHIIGNEFIRVFEEEAAKLGEIAS